MGLLTRSSCSSQLQTAFAALGLCLFPEPLWPCAWWAMCRCAVRRRLPDQRDRRAGKIRGAGLDVFYEEPLPADSPLYTLDNVLMSAHCADRTKEFQVESMEFFVHNMENYIAGRPVENIIDKNAGY